MTRGLWRPAVLLLGLAFLYAPIAMLVGYSFNDGRLATVWSGFSLRWYGELLANDRIHDAAGLSFAVAAGSATLAAGLGGIVGLALARGGPSRGRPLFVGLAAAPLVMPEVIAGIALLLLFIALEHATGWPAQRGATTLVLAHAAMGSAYVAVIVQARLAGFDRMLEEAALDLGARPGRVFRSITLPLMMPALLSGWLLAFALSLDDLVIASFVSGPGATTLPMYIYSSMRLGLSPLINALASVMIAVVFVALAVAAAVLWGRERR